MIRTKRSRNNKFVSDINITPFTDVCLVLLIIFMVTAPALIKESGLNLNLPRSTTAEAKLPTSVTVRITRDQQVFVNDDPATFETLGSLLQQHHKEFGTRLLVVKADEGVPYRLVIQTIDAAREVGVDQIALATRQPEGVSPPLQEQP